jgi:hypothetical protein
VGLPARDALPETRRGAASGKSENRSLPEFWAGVLAAALATLAMRLMIDEGKRINCNYATAVAAA